MIKSAASAASPTAWGAPRAVVRIRSVVRPCPVVPPSPVVRRSPSRRGGCASSRLDHGLKVELFPKPSQTLSKAFPNSGQPFFAIFGRASGQIYGKTTKNVEQNVKTCRKICFFCLLYRQSGFDAKVKSPKMGLSITPCQFLSRPTFFRDIWPRPNIWEKVEHIF